MCLCYCYCVGSLSLTLSLSLFFLPLSLPFLSPRTCTLAISLSLAHTQSHTHYTLILHTHYAHTHPLTPSHYPYTTLTHTITHSHCTHTTLTHTLTLCTHTEGRKRLVLAQSMTRSHYFLSRAPLSSTTLWLASFTTSQNYRQRQTSMNGWQRTVSTVFLLKNWHLL